MGRPPPVIDPADRISRLPEEVQAQILSFLPAQEAVGTCVLARTWRDIWKFTRRLLITGDSVRKLWKFVDPLLRVRRDGLELASLDASEIRSDPSDLDYHYEGTYIISSWIYRVLECQIQMLRIDLSGYCFCWMEVYNDRLFVSRHLTRLELTRVGFTGDCLNFDHCPVLEHLEITGCSLACLRKMTSLSLKRLVIASCSSYGDGNRIPICLPRLVSLLLDGGMNFRTPLLERMPELLEATVQINSSLDSCDCDDPMTCYHVTRAGGSEYAGQNAEKCVVLEGLAQARDLVLIVDHQTYIFRSDLRWCPTFSKLKTLVLNEYWCESTDCSALACMLQHSPVLEKLTVLFSGKVEPKYNVVVEGHPDATGKSTMISQHLKIVEVKCFEVHQTVVKVLRFLGTLNIWFQFRAMEGSK